MAKFYDAYKNNDAEKRRGRCLFALLGAKSSELGPLYTKAMNTATREAARAQGKEARTAMEAMHDDDTGYDFSDDKRWEFGIYNQDGESRMTVRRPLIPLLPPTSLTVVPHPHRLTRCGPLSRSPPPPSPPPPSSCLCAVAAVRSSLASVTSRGSSSPRAAWAAAS